jgi:hypothetical protein
MYPLSQEETAAKETYVTESLGYNSAFHLTCLLKFLFCEEEGWRFASVY